MNRLIESLARYSRRSETLKRSWSDMVTHVGLEMWKRFSFMPLPPLPLRLRCHLSNTVRFPIHQIRCCFHITVSPFHHPDLTWTVSLKKSRKATLRKAHLAFKQTNGRGGSTITKNLQHTLKNERNQG